MLAKEESVIVLPGKNGKLPKNLLILRKNMSSP